jgi:hypothetical protein
MAGDQTPCWSWPYAKVNGSGRMRWGEGMKQVHLIAYEEAIGPIPDGFSIRHTPKVSFAECWNPWHMSLFEGSPWTHIDRPTQAEVIRLLNEGVASGVITRTLGIDQKTIANIKRRFQP